MLQYHFNWKLLSAATGITCWNFYFRLYPTTIRGPQVVDFLGHLLRHLPGKVMVVWDGRPAGNRAVAGLRARTQSGGIHLGLLETSRAAQLLPARFRPA